MQMTELRLRRSTASRQLEDIKIPDRYNDLPTPIRSGQPLNVARSYLAVGEALRNGDSVAPDFNVAVELHETLDRIEAAAALT
jgi:hypothetical protein